jgi:DivIVA domain-containing protein
MLNRPASARLFGTSARRSATSPDRPPPLHARLTASFVGSGRTLRLGAKLAYMSSRGQSLSMFVVQRAFNRVRRGYDPEEVDRHLERVSRWFTSTDIGQALTHERTQLLLRERAVAEREAELARGVEGARLEAERRSKARARYRRGQRRGGAVDRRCPPCKRAAARRRARGGCQRRRAPARRGRARAGGLRRAPASRSRPGRPGPPAASASPRRSGNRGAAAGRDRRRETHGSSPRVAWTEIRRRRALPPTPARRRSS